MFTRIFLTATLLFCIFSTNTYSQTKHQTRQLATLAKVWGLIKYYHPGIASGKYDWDAELITSIRHINSARSKHTIDDEVKRLFAIAGADTASRYTPPSGDSIIYRNFDTSWIENSALTAANSQALHYLLQHPFSGTNFYA